MSNPITSPVERISGLSIIEAPLNLTNGNTLSFTAMYGIFTSFVNPRSFNFSPAITLAAIFASGTPIAFDVNGTVLDARGLTSNI